MDADAAGLSPVLVEAVAELRSAFERARISYAIIGGLAVGFRSRPRSTRDVDVLLAVPKVTLPGLLDDLLARGFSLDESAVIEEFGQNSITAFEFSGVRIDWLKSKLPAYRHVLATADVVTGLDDQPIRVASAEGLILLKIIASRPQDEADIAAILASNRGAIDFSRIEQEWCTIFDTADPRWVRYQKMIPEYYER